MCFCSPVRPALFLIGKVSRDSRGTSRRPSPDPPPGPPTVMHPQWVAKAIAAAKHVVCEKPAARDAEQLHQSRDCFWMVADGDMGVSCPHHCFWCFFGQPHPWR